MPAKNSRMFFRAVGKRVAELRGQLQFTQKEVADVLKVSQQTLFAYEQGHRRIPADKLDKLATFFDVTSDQLLGRKRIQSKKGPPRISPTMMRHIHTLGRLPQQQKRFLVTVANALDFLLSASASKAIHSTR